MKITVYRGGSMLLNMLPHSKAGKVDCPVCDCSIPQGSCFCYNCMNFVDPVHDRMLEEPEVTDEMLEQLLQRSAEEQRAYEDSEQQKRAAKGTIMVIAGVILTMTLILSIVGIVLAVWGVVKLVVNHPKAELLEDQYLDRIAVRYVVPKVLREQVDRLDEYSPSKRLPSKLLHDSRLTENPCRSIAGTDLIRAETAGVGFQMCRAVLYAEESSNAGFEGIVVITDPGTVSVSGISILGRKDRPDLGDGLLTGNPEFDRKFFVSAENPGELPNILTDSMQQRILELERLEGRQITLQFLKNGRLCVGIATQEKLVGEPFEAQTLSQMKDTIRTRLQMTPQLMALLRQAVAPSDGI